MSDILCVVYTTFTAGCYIAYWHAKLRSVNQGHSSAYRSVPRHQRGVLKLPVAQLDTMAIWRYSLSTA
jgi:hypothetical protein